MSPLHTLLVELVPLQIPDPSPKPPPGRIAESMDTAVAYLKWGVFSAGVIGLLICAGMVIIGRAKRGAMAIEGLIASPMVLAGLAIASSAAAIVGVFV